MYYMTTKRCIKKRRGMRGGGNNGFVYYPNTRDKDGKITEEGKKQAALNEFGNLIPCNSFNPSSYSQYDYENEKAYCDTELSFAPKTSPSAPLTTTSNWGAFKNTIGGIFASAESTKSDPETETGTGRGSDFGIAQVYPENGSSIGSHYNPRGLNLGGTRNRTLRQRQRRTRTLRQRQRQRRTRTRTLRQRQRQKQRQRRSKK
jgi:transposase